MRYSSLGRRFLGQGATLARSKSSWVCPLSVSHKEDSLNNFIYTVESFYVYFYYMHIFVFMYVCSYVYLLAVFLIAFLSLLFVQVGPRQLVDASGF